MIQTLWKLEPEDYRARLQAAKAVAEELRSKERVFASSVWLGFRDLGVSGSGLRGLGV